MGSRRYHKSDKEHTRKRRPEVSDTDDWRKAEPHAPLSPNAVMQLQHTIGNQAVQRLMDGGKMPHNVGSAIVQRDSGTGGRQDEASFPALLATITTERKGKLKGKTSIAGQEGKIEFQSLNLGKSNTTRNPDEPQPTNLTLTRQVDDLSPTFQQAMLEGDPVKTAQFEFIRRNDEGKVEIKHTLNFSDGMITSYALGSGEQQTESMGIEFRKTEA